MNWGKKGKQIFIGAAIVAFTLSAGLVDARSVSEVQAQLDQEHAAGHVDDATYVDLKSILDGATDQASLVEVQESFNVMVSVYIGSVIDAAAADRLMGPIDSL